MNRLEEMQNFVRVADAGSISKAAKRMNLAKSAVSRRLSELENRLGVRLMTRSTRGLSLTELGQGFYQRAQIIIADVNDAEQQVSREHASLKGTINVACPLTFSTMHLSPLLNGFLFKNPELDLQLHLSDRQIDLVEEGIDLAIRIGKLADSRLIARRLAPMRRMSCASPDYLKNHGIPKSPKDLQHHVGLTTTNISDAVHWQYTDKNNEKIVGRPSIRIRANNGEFLVNAAVAGHGICAVPMFISYQAIKEGTLVPILREYHLREDAIYAVYPPGRYLSKRVRVLIDYLTDNLGDNPYWELDMFN